MLNEKAWDGSQERVSKIKKMDLINLENEGCYRYELMNSSFDDVQYLGKIEAGNVEEALTLLYDKYQDEIELAADDVKLYEWIPETIEEEGRWAAVSIESKVDTTSLQMLEGKTIKSAARIFEFGSCLLRITFTDGTSIDIEDVRKKDWYISPF